MRAAVIALACVLGCHRETPLDAGAPVDAAAPDDLAQPPPCDEPNPCGDCEPGCKVFGLGPARGKPFPLEADQGPRAYNEGAVRNLAGDLQIPPNACYSYEIAFIANADDWGRGTVSKFNYRSQRELARYFTVTCGSLPSGSTQPCDGQSGCCAIDDQPRFLARGLKQPEPPRQPVQLAGTSPSRTSIDFNGMAWVANRAPGSQASVTKFASHPFACVDRNADKKLDTSSDVDGDGLIATDCNGDGQPDDIASVKAKPCKNGKAQEFFGLDDECVILTVNVGDPKGEPRGLALGPGPVDFGPSDPWLAQPGNGKLLRIDGATGRLKSEEKLADGCHPHEVVVDRSDVLWAATDGGGPLCFFDIRKSAGGQARAPKGGSVKPGSIALDRDQNVWIAGMAGIDGPTAWRYTPDRSKGSRSATGGGRRSRRPERTRAQRVPHGASRWIRAAQRPGSPGWSPRMAGSSGSRARISRSR
ncbi:MAG: hypothetical protein EXR72_02675 [Myxococcales bacterium]|nr:hypothetical protein [Myxococcales bacterium]